MQNSFVEACAKNIEERGVTNFQSAKDFLIALKKANILPEIPAVYSMAPRHSEAIGQFNAQASEQKNISL